MEIQSRATQTPAPSRPAVAQAPAPAAAPQAGQPVFAMPKAEVKVDPEKMKQNLDQAIRQLNDSMRDGGRNLAFAMDEVLGRPVIVVKKQDTGEVIRQIPNEVVIKVAHSLDKLKGLFFNSVA
jgi:flagellar protein FlaG